jgi:hypothetical protein
MFKFPLLAALLVASPGVAGAQTPVHMPNPDTRPFVLGATTTLHSAELAEERTLNIYLPEDYSPDSAARYPVIYLLDGSADEDFIHIAGLVQYCNFPWIDMLPQSIVVGIANVDRKRDFTFPTTIEADKKAFPTTGQSGRFIAFIEKELQPFIDTRYKTSGHNTLIGQSLGGLLATEILFKKPALFNDYIIISPSLWWDDESLLALQPAFAGEHPKRIFIGVGKEGKVMKKDARRLYRKMKGLKNVQAYFEYFSKEDHATIYHTAVYSAFGTLNAGKQPLSK